MFTIFLEKLEFFAHHGIHDEERMIGTTFEVSASIMLNNMQKITSIHETVNYVDIYQIISKHMQQPCALLELLAENMARDIHLLDARIAGITITIRKKNPPIARFIGEVGISFSKEYHN